MAREGMGGQECLWLVAGQGERAGDSRGGGSGGKERPQDNRQGFFLFPLPPLQTAGRDFRSISKLY